jgi:hypothetical protein
MIPRDHSTHHTIKTGSSDRGFDLRGGERFSRMLGSELSQCGVHFASDLHSNLPRS